MASPAAEDAFPALCDMFFPPIRTLAPGTSASASPAMYVQLFSLMENRQRCTSFLCLLLARLCGREGSAWEIFAAPPEEAGAPTVQPVAVSGKDKKERASLWAVECALLRDWSPSHPPGVLVPSRRLTIAQLNQEGRWNTQSQPASHMGMPHGN